MTDEDVTKPWEQIEAVCQGCEKRPHELYCYTSVAEMEGMSPEQWVYEEEGTYNEANGHFLCDSCYIAAGMPSSPFGWTCP